MEPIGAYRGEGATGGSRERSRKAADSLWRLAWPGVTGGGSPKTSVSPGQTDVLSGWTPLETKLTPESDCRQARLQTTRAVRDGL